jgi:hypothetical protein
MTDLAVDTYVGAPVKAIRLTAENAQAVADWIDGQHSSRDMTIKSDEGKTTVKSTRVYLDRNQRRKGGAWHFGSVGDWFIMDAEGVVRIFPDDKFQKIFILRENLLASEAI